MNHYNCRDWEQAKHADRLELKGRWLAMVVMATCLIHSDLRIFKAVSDCFLKQEFFGIRYCYHKKCQRLARKLLKISYLHVIEAQIRKRNWTTNNHRCLIRVMKLGVA